MTKQAFAILLACAFTVGCAMVQALKYHAQPVTAVLSIVVLCLGPFVGLVSLAQKTEPGSRAERLPTARSTR